VHPPAIGAIKIALMDLLQAIRSGEISSVRAVIKADRKSALNPRAAGAAAGAAFQPALALLKKSGADLNAIWRGYRPLHSLIQERPHADAKPTPERLACLEWLLANGADPELTGAWPPARAVIVAAFLGEPEFVKRLFKGGAKRNGFVYAALGDHKQFEKALKSNPGLAHDRDVGGLTALQCAAGSKMPKANAFEIARMLLDAGADLRVKTKSWSHQVDATHFAVSSKNRPIFELLLDRGADATEALTPALWGSKLELAQIAMDRGGDPDRAMADGQPLLNNLIRWGQFRQAMWLLERGASPNIADARGWTAMHQAASRGNEKMMRALIEAGGDLTRRDGDDKLPRDIATREKISQMLSMRRRA
jgi:ankyrin repeat protein